MSPSKGDEGVDLAQGNSFGWVARLGNITDAVFEVFTDPELRRKAQTMVYSEAGKQIKGIQEGVASRATTIQRVGEGIPRQLQGVMGRMQSKIQLQRREASLKARRDQPVDVQVGPFLWEDAPQELRSRLWIALLFNPDLIGNLVDEKRLEDEIYKQRTSSPGDSPNETEDKSPKWQSSSAATDSSTVAGPLLDSLPNGTPSIEQSLSQASEPGEKLLQDKMDETRDQVLRAEGILNQPPASPLGAANATSSPQETRSADGNKSPLQERDSHDEDNEDLSHTRDATVTEEQVGIEQKLDEKDSEDVWEIVQDASSLIPRNTSRLQKSEGSRLLSDQLRSSASSIGDKTAPKTLRDKLLEATWEVDWPISIHYPEGCRYETLCQISVGQEEIEEVIERDIDRTFPEHPQFSFAQGQQQLFRVLKAYSLHDLQVGYCQGMAFVTGVILMYIPEEPAFRLLARLMDERGANLRHLYLPGLEGLKNYLRMLEWLLDRTNPDLKEHLEEYGVSPVLYASQWFLTAFSCPFPAAFSCRVIDVMLTENCGHAMLRVAMAVLKACSEDLMQLHDFESLITHLKVEPVSWGPQKSRKVLNEAIGGHISDAMLSAASEAINGGYDGSLARTRSSVRRDQNVTNENTSDEPLSTSKEEVAPKLKLPNQISGLEKSSSSSGLGRDAEQAADSEGKMMLAMDALWLSNADEAVKES